MSDTRKHILEHYAIGYHFMINNALDWLDEHEPKWNLEKPIDRYKYIKELIKGTKQETSSLD